MSAILAVETSTLTASVALSIGNDRVIERESGVNTHAEVLLDLIDECLKEAGLALSDLETIAVGAGPGSFTGLRIGMATVKGLCFATGVSLTAVSSLAALWEDCRQAIEGEALLVPVLDARRKEIFVSMYRASEAIGSERVLAPEELAELVAEQAHAGERIVLFGDGASKYLAQTTVIGEVLRDCRQTPSARAVARLARTIASTATLAETAPSYVRLPEAQIKFPNGNTGGTFAAKKG